MAKRRKVHNGSRWMRKSRHRSVGALNPSSSMVKLASLAAGYFIGDTVNDQINKFAPASIVSPTDPKSIMAYAIPAAELGIGGMLLLSKKKQGMLKTVAGGILAGAGLKAMLKKAGIIAGYQSVPVIGGYQSVPVVGSVPNMLTGASPYSGVVPNQLSGYRVNGYRPNGSRVMGSFTDPGNIAVNSAGSGGISSGRTDYNRE